MLLYKLQNSATQIEQSGAQARMNRVYAPVLYWQSADLQRPCCV
jgi:hypothetical protein